MITITKGQWFPLTIGNISYAGAAFDLQGATEVSASLVSTLGVKSSLNFEITAYNELSAVSDGSLSAGKYAIELSCKGSDGKSYRMKSPGAIIEVSSSTTSSTGSTSVRVAGDEWELTADVEMHEGQARTYMSLLEEARKAAMKAADDAEAVIDNVQSSVTQAQEASNAAKSASEAASKAVADTNKALENVTEMEATVNEAESKRAQSEQNRETAEAERVSAEKARAAAETERAASEAGRANAETQRESDFSAAKAACETAASNATIAADKANTAAEKANAAAQEASTKAENIVTNANNVVSDANNALQSITTMENTVSTAEQKREEAESERVTAEQKREEAESERVTAEQKREEAESERVTAEQKRETMVEGYMVVIKKPIVSTSDTTLGMDANKLYAITVGAALTLNINAATDTSITNDWEGCFDTGATAPTVTWPADVNWGTSNMTLAANTHYEFSIRQSGGKYYGILYGWSLS